jgi:hypothetical protein
MDIDGVRSWFDTYLEVFASLGRGDSSDVAQLLDFYGVPMVFGRDEGMHVLQTEERVLSLLKKQIDGLRADGYHHSETLDSQIDINDETAATYRGHFSRQRADGSEIRRLAVTYRITEGANGLRFSVVVVDPQDQ